MPSDAHLYDDVPCKDLAAAKSRGSQHEAAQDRLTRGTPSPVETQLTGAPDRRIEAQELDRCGRRPFRAFVAADYEEVYRALARLQGRLTTVLEWGSGLGVVTIMASNLGFEAYGIESEPHLVDLSRRLAHKYGPGARFVTGSFIPREYQWNPETADEAFRSDVDAEPAYDDLTWNCEISTLCTPSHGRTSSFCVVISRGNAPARIPLFPTYEAREGRVEPVRDRD